MTLTFLTCLPVRSHSSILLGSLPPPPLFLYISFEASGSLPLGSLYFATLALGRRPPFPLRYPFSLTLTFHSDFASLPRFSAFPPLPPGSLHSHFPLTVPTALAGGAVCLPCRTRESRHAAQKSPHRSQKWIMRAYFARGAVQTIKCRLCPNTKLMTVKLQ